MILPRQSCITKLCKALPLPMKSIGILADFPFDSYIGSRL